MPSTPSVGLHLEEWDRTRHGDVGHHQPAILLPSQTVIVGEERPEVGRPVIDMRAGFERELPACAAGVDWLIENPFEYACGRLHTLVSRAPLQLHPEVRERQVAIDRCSGLAGAGQQRIEVSVVLVPGLGFEPSLRGREFGPSLSPLLDGPRLVGLRLPIILAHMPQE